jgi:tetratricopeptide (TPR) repeat protein
VIVRLDAPIDEIQGDRQSGLRTEEPLVFTVNDQSNGHFVNFLLLIDVLIQMKSIETDKQQFITCCKEEYKNNDTQLALIHEFEREYTSEVALWWYTRNSFLSEMLNKALRIQDMDLLFLFRFVISDIYQHLKQNQCQSSVRVYRGQVMAMNELNILRQSTRQLISINSFMSTSLNYYKALLFLNQSKITNDVCRVLFDIKADPRVVTTKPFADIRSFSEFPEEREVLFMAGSVFRLIDIRQDENKQLWVISMRLCSDKESGLKTLFDYMKKDYGGGDKTVNLLSFSDVLRNMGKCDLAEKIYYRLLAELPPSDPSLFKLYYSLGYMMLNKNDYDASLDMFNKSLEIYKQRGGSDHIKIGNIYNSMGEAYRLKDDDNTALEYYEKAIELFQQTHYETHSYLSSDHRSMAMSYNNMGCVYYKRCQYDLAMKYYELSLKINEKSLPPQHPDIGICYENIGLVYEGQKQWKQALENYQKAATIRRYSLFSQHPDVIKIEKDIQRVSSKLE